MHSLAQILHMCVCAYQPFSQWWKDKQSTHTPLHSYLNRQLWPVLSRASTEKKTKKKNQSNCGPESEKTDEREQNVILKKCKTSKKESNDRIIIIGVNCHTVDGSSTGN